MNLSQKTKEEVELVHYAVMESAIPDGVDKASVIIALSRIQGWMAELIIDEAENTMYLYIFDDGFVQSSTPPDADDLVSIADGYLEIIRFDDGDLQTCNADGEWRSVDRREEAFGVDRVGKA